MAVAGRQCTVCGHSRVRDIDRLLLSGTPASEIEAKFPGVHRRAIDRHKNNHLLPKIRKVDGLTRDDLEDGRSLLSQMEGLRERASALLDQAEKANDLRAAIAALREIRGTLESIGRITGEGEAAGVVVNVFTGPAWIAVQTNILNALVPFPDAREAVVKALEGVDSE